MARPPRRAAAGRQPPAAGPIVWVVVLGDFGRSPRMQFHALSLAEQVNEREYGGLGLDEGATGAWAGAPRRRHPNPFPPTPLSPQAGCDVHVLAYGDTPPLASLEASKRLHMHALAPAPAWTARLPRALGLPIKALLQLAALLWATLFVMPRPASAIVQVPPALPVLPALALAALLRRFRLVLDWHNFGFTIMALTMGGGHPLVQLAQRAEQRWGGAAAAHLCVTRAMARELAGPAWRLRNVRVFHDRPPKHFAPPGGLARHALLARLAGGLGAGCHARDHAAGPPPKPRGGEPADAEVTHLTLKTGRGALATVRPRRARPALVVSSTSWTPDEDFGVLLDAAISYDAAAATDAGLPELLIVVTGRGPLRAMYEARFATTPLTRVAFRTLWLESADYPLLLGAADVGVSLHTSSSGLDLPMKAVDMFGAGVPVLAASFAALPELVAHGVNGMAFRGAGQLAAQLAGVLRGLGGRPGGDRRRAETSLAAPAPGGAGGYGDEPPALAALRRGVAASAGEGWEESWEKVVRPLLLP